MVAKVWTNWCTVEDLSWQWQVSKRRVQQILARMFEQNECEKATIIADRFGAKPVYRRVY